ncbi:MAG TPA: CdaR family protein [Pyrinomonadaceae bacterium]|nr:CdaR family protein [Pyrinomonadaceae bacterium]
MRKVFIEDWGLKLLALIIAIALWLGVTGQNKPVTLRVTGVQLNYLRPDGLDLSNEPPTTVDVTLTGSKEKLDRIGPRDLIANVDLSDQRAGERVLRLTLDRVKMDVQEDVKIEGFHPATIQIRLEPIVEALVDVEVKFEGNLPEGYELGGVSVTPAKVKLRGPADRVAALRKASTETVWLDGKKEGFNLSHVEINIPDPKIEAVDTSVNVRVDVTEKKRSDLHLPFLVRDNSPYLANILRPIRYR